MDRLLEENGEYDRTKYSDKVCSKCGKKIPLDSVDTCEQVNGDYLCSDCITTEESDKREEERFKRELEK